MSRDAPADRTGRRACAPTWPRSRPLDADAMAAAAARLDRLTKPPGSLGRLEDLVIQLAGITGRADASGRRAGRSSWPPPTTASRAQGVSAYPAEVTAQMVANFVAGGAAINVLAAAVGRTGRGRRRRRRRDRSRRSLPIRYAAARWSAPGSAPGPPT